MQACMHRMSVPDGDPGQPDPWARMVERRLGRLGRLGRMAMAAQVPRRCRACVRTCAVPEK